MAVEPAAEGAAHDRLLDGLVRALQAAQDPEETAELTARLVAAVREGERRMRLQFEQAGDGIWLADENLRYIEANDAASEMLGYSHEEFLRLRVTDVLRSGEDERHADLMARLGAGEAVTDVWELRKRDGTFIPVELSMSTVGLGRIQAIGRDVSQRRRADAERELLLSREREVNRQLSLLQRATAALAGTVTPAEVGHTAVAHITDLLAATSVAVWSRSPDGALHVLAVGGRSAAASARFARLPADLPDPIGAALRDGFPRWLCDDAGWAGTDPAVRAGVERAGYAGLVCLPLTVAGERLGMIMAGLTEPRLFDAGERVTAGTLAGQCAQGLHRARLHQAEHEVADVLQRSLLPAELPVLARLPASAVYTPAGEEGSSGGDWYEMLPLPGSRVALAVGDVVGQGPSAAAVMGQLRSALAAYLLDGYGPAAALERLDRFASRVAGARGSTCACLTLDWATGVLTWALAGHPPPLLVDATGARFAEGGAGAVLGVRGRPSYRDATLTVGTGTSVVLYSDGLVERRGETIDDGLDRLAAAAAARADLGPDRLVTALADALLDATAPADDVAVLAVRSVPAPLVATLPAAAGSLARVRRLVGRWAGAAGLPPTQAEDLDLALGEAAANATEHAYPPGTTGTFLFGVERLPDGGLAVHVRDRGSWRPPPADPGHRGHGLRMIGALTHDLSVDHRDGGTEVRFRVPAPDGAVLRDLVVGGPAARPVPAAVERVTDADGASTLYLHGDLDRSGCDAVGPALVAAAAAPGPLTVDLSAVGHLSSAGVALLAALAGRADVVVAAGTPPARVLDVTGLAATLPVRRVAAR